MLFIAGDSSGGGSATSALLAQSSPAGLPSADGARLSGGVMFSPWLNLPCDTPSYVSQAYKLESVPTANEHTIEKCSIPGLTKDMKRTPVNIGGDVAFTGYPPSRVIRGNGETYAGSAKMMLDPFVANASGSDTLQNAPVQIHVGLGEVLIAENVIFATKMAAAAAPVGILRSNVARVLNVLRGL